MLQMPTHRVESIQQLRTLIAEPPAMMSKRLQTQIDDYCLTIIENASVCAVGFADPALDIEYFNLRETPVVRAQGASIVLHWPTAKHLPEALQQGAELACSLYFIMPGIGFAMRANGRSAVAQSAAGALLEFSAVALFVHCSRAKVRAQFWDARAPRLPHTRAANGLAELSDAAIAFIASSSYLLMLTQNASGATELSPRGDPAGFVQVMARQTLLIPERPGNKVACTLSNILANGAVTVSFLIPGSSSVLSVAGRAWLTSERKLLEPLAINAKVPVVATVLQVERFSLRACPELLEAGLWNSDTHLRESDIPSFSKILSEHMNGKGLLGKATNVLVNAVVKHDLKHLY